MLSNNKSRLVAALLPLLVSVSVSVSLSACTWETDLPDDARSIEIKSDRELLITDDAVLTSPAMSSNHDNAPLSFRHALSSLPVSNQAALRFLSAWAHRLEEEGHPDRAQSFDEKVTCAWLKRTPANQCDAKCGACADHSIDLDLAPFRLIAVANRSDLSMLSDVSAVGAGGEGRLVYALTNGAADDPSSPTLPFTVIFEYAQEGSAKDWAQRWHSLGSVTPEAFPTSLAALTSTFVDKGSLAQIRTADAATGSAIILHEFAIEPASGEIVPKNVRNSPDWTRVSEGALTDFATTYAESIREGTFVLPREWWASASSPADVVPAYVQTLPEHDGLLKGTCAGCHALSENGFQIDPLAKGDKKISRFLTDNSKNMDELRRRTIWMQWTLH